MKHVISHFEILVTFLKDFIGYYIFGAQPSNK